MTMSLTAINEGPLCNTGAIGGLPQLAHALLKRSLTSEEGSTHIYINDMAKVCRLHVGILTALVALCKYSLAAEWNATEESANRTVSLCHHHHGNGDNCTADTKDIDQWTGHFSKCPEELTNYCIHGECRYIREQKAPSCRCQRGYIGARCEYLDLDWRIGERRQIIIACVIAGLVCLILVIMFIFFCSHRRCRSCWRRGRRREEPRNGIEKHRMMDTGATHATSTADSTV